MEYRNFTAKTVDEAITAACLDLGVTSDRLEYDVIQEGSSGFLLGIGSRPAVIRAKVQEDTPETLSAPVKETEDAKASEAAAPEKKEGRIITNDEIEKRAAAAAARAKTESRPETDQKEKPEKKERKRGGRESRTGARERSEARRPAAEVKPKAVEEIPVPPHEPSKPKPEREIHPRTEEEAAALTGAAEAFLRDVFAAMGIDAKIETSYDQAEGAVNCIFDGEDMGLLIGKRGTTLDSLQYLTSLVVNRQTGEYVRVKLDTEDYRARRADALSNLARNIAYKVKRSRKPYSLEAMNPYERRIIHSSLQGNKFVETYSEGEEPYRHVVIAPKR